VLKYPSTHEDALMFYIGNEVLTAAVTNGVTLWNIAPCSSYVNRRFGGAYRLHIHGKKLAEQESSRQQVTRLPWIRNHVANSMALVSCADVWITGVAFQLVRTAFRSGGFAGSVVSIAV
jgi:hypothetical protein